jgi:hypothetical protein
LLLLPGLLCQRKVLQLAAGLLQVQKIHHCRFSSMIPTAALLLLLLVLLLVLLLLLLRCGLL